MKWRRCSTPCRMTTRSKAERVLEINVNHPIFEKLTDMFKTDKDKLKKFTEVLYNGAILIEGLSVDDPVELSNDICDLIG